ncbi:MAG TPA: BrnT family toxin [Rhizomicrobium sp.]|jgi:hypothetical protein
MLGIGFDLVVGFEWDAGNARKSSDKHNVSQGEAEQMFFGWPLLVVEDTKHSAVEPRFHALGVTETGRLLHATFALRHAGTRIRIISAREMSRKERNIYAEEKRNTES